MHTFTPVPASPAATQPGASAALKRLEDSGIALSGELQHLPKPPQALLDALQTQRLDQVEQEMASLLQSIENYWHAPSASGQPRDTLLAASLCNALQDEVALKRHEYDLSQDASACLVLSGAADSQPRQNEPSAWSLYVSFNESLRVEIKGALVMSTPAGRTLLALPASGLTEYPTQQAMLETVARWLNDKQLRWALLINADQRHQDAAFAIADDPDLFIESFEPSHIHLKAITAAPYRHALLRQLDKQCEDVRYVCSVGLNADPAHQARQIDEAIGMHGLFGPLAMLEQREQALAERNLRTGLPEWIKIAAPADLKTYVQHLKRYDQAREALDGALNGASSAEQYACVSLRASLASDLGYDLQPESITVSTQRTLPVTGQTYLTTRSLPQLALYGLHPGDQQSDSQFLTGTTVHINNLPVSAAHARLTPAYIARTIDSLDLRVRFGEYQRTMHAKAENQQQMLELIRLQVAQAAYAAKMQGHISAGDWDIIEAITRSTPAVDGAAITTQHIRINNSNVLGRILLFRKDNAQGMPERLIMFASEAPRAQLFQGFDNPTQLLHELVGWTANAEMSDYLLQQVPALSRPVLQEALQALGRKPQPEANFIEQVSLASYEDGLRNHVSELIAVAHSNHATHTPDWFVRASAADRQALIALEDAVAGAVCNYEAQSHTRVPDFEDYVHQRASEKICQLLQVAAGTVNPNHIVIASERETLTYTQMMRNGYDDSLSLITATADTTATFTGPPGVDLSPLTPAGVARSVHGKWLADDYAALIRCTLLSPQSASYGYRRQASTLITCLQMQAAALRSLLKGHVDAAQYHCLKTVIDNLHRNEADVRARYPVYPLQIHIDKPLIASRLQGLDQLVFTDTNLTHVETVQGCFALLSADNRLAAMLFTPQAPDGVEFRVFSSFVESLSQPGMIDYYKDRCRIKARRTLSFFLDDLMQGKGNKRPTLARESISDFAQFCFNRPIERKLRDAADTTTGRHDMLSKVIWNSVEIIATVLTLPFPPASFAVGVALSLRDSYKALQALSGESPDEANAHILASVLNMAGAAGDLSQGLKGFGGVLRKLGRDARTVGQPPALKQPLNLGSREKLYPVSLQDEPFLVSKPDINGQARIYRSTDTDMDHAYATRHYAVRDSSGAWQPLGQSPTPAIAQRAERIGTQHTVNISLKDLPRVTDGHAAGISLANGKHYIEMNGLVYQVHYDASIRCWYIVDPQNPFAFFGRQPVRFNGEGRWQRVERSGLRGGGKVDSLSFRPLHEEAASSGSETSLRDYEIPKHYQAHLDSIIGDSAVDDLGSGLEDYFEMYYSEMRENYKLLKEKLHRHANAFFDPPPVLPPRPPVPVIEPSMSVDSFLERVFANSNGLVISEAPLSIASKRFLISHMRALVEQRVKVIYLPHLFTDKHVDKLVKYRLRGNTIRFGSREIKSHLKYINGGALNNQSREFDYYHLIKQAHRHGIEVRPLSSSASYPIDNITVQSIAADSAGARKMSNFFAHKVISGDVAATPAQRWVALLDQKLATAHDQVPGISELQGAISVHIEDVPAGRPTRISVDSNSATAQARATLCDFKVEVANPAMAKPEAPTAVPTASTSSASPVTLPYSAEVENVGVRWDESSGWIPVNPGGWIVYNPPTALQRSLLDAAYELPAELGGPLHHLAYAKHRGLDANYFVTEEELIPTQQLFFELRRKLRDDAQSLLLADIPSRPVMPVVEPQVDTSQFIRSLYQHTDGMVIGEFHSSIASKKLIIENLPLLAEQNVKTLYMEHLLTDLHQADLDRFFETGHMSRSLLSDIRQLDQGHLTDPDKAFNFEKLIIRAQQHGLEIRAIDCAASYHLKGIRLATATTRQQMMNYFASRAIRRHQAVMGRHKWVALVGNSHANNYQRVPGIAELEGAIGLNVSEVPVGMSRGITLDPGEMAQMPHSSEKGFIKGDFRVEMEIPGTLVDESPHVPLSVEQRLEERGTFLIEQQPDNVRQISHRSRDNTVHRTLVQTNAAGEVFIDSPRWPALHLKPFANIEALALALQRYGLKRLG